MNKIKIVASLYTSNPELSEYYRNKGARPSTENNKYTHWYPNDGDWTDANQNLLT